LRFVVDVKYTSFLILSRSRSLLKCFDSTILLVKKSTIKKKISVNEYINYVLTKISIWNRKQRFRKITFGLYRNAEGIALAYDISQESTFKSLDRWLTDIVQYGGESMPKIVVGNKTVPTFSSYIEVTKWQIIFKKQNNSNFLIYFVSSKG
jgi:hypothetical protein